jgi:hypothetical protein
MRDRCASIALDVGWKHKLSAPQIHALAKYIATLQGHEQKLIQTAVKWAKNEMAR